MSMLTIHSLMRWAVLLAAVWATTKAWHGWRSGRPWDASHRVANLLLLITADLQLVLGALVWMGSDIVRMATADMGAAMKVASLRFYSVEHATIAVIALAVLHVTYAKVKRAAEDVDKHRIAAIGFGLSWVILLASVPWPFRLGIGRPWLPW